MKAAPQVDFFSDIGGAKTFSMTDYLRDEMQQRTAMLLGDIVMAAINRTRVIIFGVGGVGSWCAMSLARTGIGHITIVDCDIVCASNCNRQLMAMPSNIGQPKAIALQYQLHTINPFITIDASTTPYNTTTADTFNIQSYNYVIDAIDSVADKAQLILHATNAGVTLFSSMGAALRTDPFQIKKAEFWKIKGDALARALRNKFKKSGVFPKHKFLCVYSDEAPIANASAVNNINRKPTNGSISHITGMFGLALAGMLIDDIRHKAKASSNT